jgi:hypothetical protein
MGDCVVFLVGLEETCDPIASARIVMDREFDRWRNFQRNIDLSLTGLRTPGHRIGALLDAVEDVGLQQEIVIAGECCWFSITIELLVS